VIRDYPGNYTQYREAVAKGTLTDERQIMKAEPKPAEISLPPAQTTTTTQKLSFKEKREFEALEKDIPTLTAEKTALEKTMNEGNPGFDELQKSAERINVIIQLLDEKENRWLELSDRV
ncbi:MAG: ABC transporter C-terminal domain-containing protein, partial [Ferruginibacter sp.]|nr:ABC transporter C-terminal domain-containing protein [Ferruginibacter sp.]